jgi:hypothetical protein
MDGGSAPFDEAVDPVQAVLSATGYFQNAMRLAAQGRQPSKQRQEKRAIALVEGYIEEDRVLGSGGEGEHERRVFNPSGI